MLYSNVGGEGWLSKFKEVEENLLDDIRELQKLVSDKTATERDIATL